MTKYLALLLLSPFSLLGQSNSAPTNTEEPPTLSAKEILQPDFLAGDGFTVNDEVPTSTGLNRYLIQWDYAAWTDNAANFIGLLKASDFGKKKAGLTIAISGDASPFGQHTLKEENIELVTRIGPGPLR
jgi:hypothetical protein